ncbi:hypothetical protein EJB05_36349, partial [Eragrostis curvula]
MKKGGLKDENIIVFMYDDIANNTENPWPGVIINHPNGTDVYAGVPKDYTGNNVNVHNFLAVLLGDNSNLTGGSGKVVINSGPDDHISSSTTPITRRRKAISPTALKAITTLGDLYSVSWRASWMEDSHARDLRNESLAQQYEAMTNEKR